MATNLNFQQPPRSISSAVLTSRSTGHVTPTSMFPPSGGGPQQAPQLSPNRNPLAVGAGAAAAAAAAAGATPSSMFNAQRAFNAAATTASGGGGGADRRSMPGLGGPIANFMQTRGYGSQSGNSFHSVFGTSAADTGTPPLLDLSEFPSLTTGRGGTTEPGAMPPSGAMQPPGSKPYVGMVKQPTNEQTEFTMSSEDFPALPGTQSADGALNAAATTTQLAGQGGEGHEKMAGGAAGMSMGMDLQATDSSTLSEKALKRGVQTSPDGKVTNIPASMVNNQFGMVGLLTFIRAAESDPNLVSLAMGQDLTALGLNLNSQENLYPSFGGPFADAPARPQDIDYNVPPEYLINASIRDKLAPISLKKYKDDVLFYLFYTYVGDIMQLLAAVELHNRDWRYHTEEKVWITRVPGMSTFEKNGTTERGTYYYFDAQNWRRVIKEFQIDTLKLDKMPNLSGVVNLSGQPV